MARVTVEDCLEEVENRFALVLLASERARELRKGQGPERIFPSENKELVHALREVAEGYVRFDETSKEKLREVLSSDAFEGEVTDTDEGDETGT
ncbi:MAG: DNA-directed RNA polymerase subunit omega [Bradymonadaceae bacterium]